VRALLAGLGVVALLVVLAVVRSAYGDEPTLEQRRCHELRIAANAVAQREDTVADEVEYLRRAEAAEEACALAGD
jgi:hypothetical protein